MDKLEYYRNLENQIDGQLRALLLSRFDLSRKIAREKERRNLTVYDGRREQATLAALAKDLPLPEGRALQEVWKIIFLETRKLQFVYRQSEGR